jgi:hypothetical protein
MDAIQMIKSLVAGSAFVWGFVDVRASEARPSQAKQGSWYQGGQETPFTDEALRRAVIHLRQVVPSSLSIAEPFREYQQSLQQVFGTGQEESRQVQMMVSLELPEQLQARYVQAVRKIREDLGEGKPGMFLIHKNNDKSSVQLEDLVECAHLTVERDLEEETCFCLLSEGCLSSVDFLCML